MVVAGRGLHTTIGREPYGGVEEDGGDYWQEWGGMIVTLEVSGMEGMGGLGSESWGQRVEGRELRAER